MAITRMIDLNADLGEGCKHDKELMALISSCNIACGGHTGNAESMTEAVLLAKLYNVSVGAHPSYPDKDNFGRISIPISKTDLEESLIEQLSSLGRIASDCGVTIAHIKPHGALYHDVAKSENLSQLLIRCSKLVFPDAAIMGPPNSQIELVCRQHNREFIREGFADRRYTDEGFLVPRSDPTAIIDSDTERCEQALSLAQGNLLQTNTGRSIIVNADSICIHGDTEGALASTLQIKQCIEIANFTIKARIYAT